jgi:hypothetical protein
MEPEPEPKHGKCQNQNRNWNRNVSKVRTGTGIVKNSHGSATLLKRNEGRRKNIQMVTEKMREFFFESFSRSSLFQGWKEQLDKAREHYNELKLGASNSLEHFLGYEDEEEDDLSAMRPRRRVSRRGSHLSSLAHSHSGSIELQESARRDPSFELR